MSTPTTVTEFFSVKGGAGCSTAALLYAAGRPHPTLIIGMAWKGKPSDLPTLAGVPAPVDDTPVELGPRLSLRITRRAHREPPVPMEGYGIDQVVLQAGHAGFEEVVLDTGTHDLAATYSWGAHVRHVVTRNCILYARALAASERTAEADRMVVLNDEARALRPRDLEGFSGVPLLASLPASTAMARAIDAGTLLFGAGEPSRLSRLLGQ